MISPRTHSSLNRGKATAALPLDERLERGELVVFERCPFALPEGRDLQFLLSRNVTVAKNISFYPDTSRIDGHPATQPDEDTRLAGLLREFHQNATNWLARVLPRYHAAARIGPLRFRTEEEEDRPGVELRLSGSALHVDMSSDAPAHGESFLRIFTNINPVKSREWITSDPLSVLLDRWDDQVRAPGEKRPKFTERFKLRFGRALGLEPLKDSPYHQLMSRLHFFGKTDTYLQQQAPKQHWIFPPGSAWLVFSDLASHAVVRGQYAIDQTYLIPAHAFRNRARSTAAVIERFWQRRPATLPSCVRPSKKGNLLKAVP